MFFLFFPISDICSEKWFQCGWTLLSSLWSLHCSLPFSSCNPPRWVLFCRSLQRFAPPDCVNALSEAFFYLLPFPPFYRSHRICFIYDIYIQTHTHRIKECECVCIWKNKQRIFHVLTSSLLLICPASCVLHDQLMGMKTAWGLWYAVGGRLWARIQVKLAHRRTLTPFTHTCCSTDMLPQVGLQLTVHGIPLTTWVGSRMGSFEF